MTTERRFERQLPDLLDDLYLGPSPDYRDEVLAVAARSRQRPAWTFPGRWFPMADLAGRSAFVPRLPLRGIATALLILGLLAAAAIAYVGSHQTRVPPPFGLAGNGLIAYAADGDIFTADPITGETRPLVTGPEIDREPRFSRDGTLIAILRQDDAGQFRLAVVGRGGGEVRVLTTDIIGVPDLVEWSADSAALIVNTADAKLIRYDVTGKAPPLVLAEGVHVQPGGFQPPDGAQILYQPDGIARTALWVMNADGTGKHSLFEGGPPDAAGAISGTVAWSPDGRFIGFGLNGASDAYARIHVMNADGTGLKSLDDEAGNGVDNDLVWSPDGTRIAFNRWRQDPGDGTWKVLPIGIVSVAGGPIIAAGPTPVSDGASFDWSPDGKSIVSVPGTILQWPNPTMTSAKPVLIDAVTGDSHELGWAVGSATSWQRTAP